MRILLTGATGFVGGRVAARLRGRGDEVVAPVRRASEPLERSGVRQVEGGFAALTPALLADVDAVVHAAATAGPDLEAVRAVNRDGTRSVVEAVLAAGAPRLVHVSTTAVYDLDAAGDDTLTEDARLVTASDSPSPYALTKAEAEQEVAHGRAAGLWSLVLRPPAVLGAGPTSVWGTRMPGMVRDGAIPPRNPVSTFAWVHVEDLVDAVLAALDRGGDAGRSDATAAVNVVGGHVPVETYLREVAALVGVDPPLDPTAAGWRGRYADDRLPATLGIRPTRGFREAIDEIVAAWPAMAEEGRP
jgi:2-alkyl-3-oxoalkanoate reductase